MVAWSGFWLINKNLARQNAVALMNNYSEIDYTISSVAGFPNRYVYELDNIAFTIGNFEILCTKGEANNFAWREDHLIIALSNDCAIIDGGTPLVLEYDGLRISIQDAGSIVAEITKPRLAANTDDNIEKLIIAYRPDQAADAYGARITMIDGNEIVHTGDSLVQIVDLIMKDTRKN